MILTSTEPDQKCMMCCKPPVPLNGQKTRSLHDILTWLIGTEKLFLYIRIAFIRVKYGPSRYNIILDYQLSDQHLADLMGISSISTLHDLSKTFKRDHFRS